MTQPYVSTQGYPGMAGRGPVRRPGSVELAVGLMRLQALLVLPAIPSVWLYREDIGSMIREGIRRSGQQVDPALLGKMFLVVLAVVILIVALTIALWLWMASANGKGRWYARTTVTVLFVLALVAFGLAHLRGLSTGNLILNLTSLMLEAAMVVCLYLPASRQYFREMALKRGFR